MASKTKKLTNDEIATMTQTNLQNAQGWDSDELQRNMTDAIDYYLGRKPQATGEGNSNVVSTDVADMVEAVLSNMVPSITSDSAIAFDADSAEDESSADMESDAVNTMIHDRNDGFTLFVQAVKDALLLKVGIIKVFVKTNEQTRTDKFRGLNELELGSLL